MLAWFYLFYIAIMGSLALYHLSTHKQRNNSESDVIYLLKDTKKIHTESKMYRTSIISAYVVLGLSLVILFEMFRNTDTTALLFLLLIPVSFHVLFTLDKLFEVRSDRVIFSGYQAHWHKIRQIGWLKKQDKFSTLMMELNKGTKIRIKIPKSETKELEKVLKQYVQFEDDLSKKTSTK
ncbi:hypothetical protein [Texcoconibacillus texcoconensis]|uniref:DUF5673 domain-containing protein n=1 Tax=Texcoconibacillus texcoconensis TaxID=1095777 RepID=A0A840QSR4_9BACI|nr:hypothetical protein [Texcoconibacillus texcoconensis]MBB5174353.1 hypothetical protein [Texcoconibacillus texcoconensis]